MKKVLIIGGSGSWGQELTKQLIEKKNPDEIRIYSRGEHKQVAMAHKFNNQRIKYIIGDIRDYGTLLSAAKGCDHIFHLAALKHVPVCERNPEETVKTNITGTINAVNVAIAAEVETFILVSTDKAVDPINVYGVSKSMAEKIVINANLNNMGNRFVCIRGGNVLGTNGSVVPLFKEQIIKANEITITDPEMTRYIMRLEDAISLIFKAVTDTKGGEIFVMKMPSFKVTDLAEVMITELGNKNTKTRKIGIRPGEKLHEVLVSRYESSKTFEYENYFVILPNMNINNIYEKWNVSVYLKKEYNSNENIFLDKHQLKELLFKDGWLNKKSVKELEKYTKDELLNYFRLEGWQ